MSPAVASLNIALGLVYLMIGAVVLNDMVRGRSRGFTHFGMAFVVLAVTCGPHHLVHGIHVAAEGRAGGALDLIAVAIGLPAGAVWVALRFEALGGGAGDRFIPGAPPWLILLPVFGGIYATAIVAAMLEAGTLTLSQAPLVAANVVLIGLYLGVGYFLLRTQLANRGPLGGFSASGVGLTLIFFTCAMMHAVYAYYGLTGLYDVDSHGIFIDVVSIPGTIYFLWVVRALYNGSFRDWNGAPQAASLPGRAAAPARS